MRHVKQLFGGLLLIALFLGAFLLPLRPAQAASMAIPAYGSISYSESLQHSFFSFAGSKKDAEKKAWTACVRAEKRAISAYKNDCNSIVWVHNGYLSIALSANGSYGSGWGSTRSIAKYSAQQVCKTFGGKICNAITTESTSLHPQKSSEGGPGPGYQLV